MMNQKGRVWVAIVVALAVIIFLAVVLIPVFTPARRSIQRSVPGQAKDVAAVYDSDAAEEGYAPVAWNVVLAAAAPRMVISTAHVGLQVADAEVAHDKIAQLAADAGGFINSSSMDNSDGRKVASLTLRVPSARYAAVLADITKLGRVISKEQEGQDVTEEYVDLQSRIRNLQREEEAFLKVLGRATKIPDILAVERELSRVRGEIEQAAGRIKYLQDRVSLATINVRLEESSPSVSSIVTWDVGRSAKGAVNALMVVLRGLTTVVVWLAIFSPLWILTGGVIYGVNRRRLRDGSR